MDKKYASLSLGAAGTLHLLLFFALTFHKPAQIGRMQAYTPIITIQLMPTIKDTLISSRQDVQNSMDHTESELKNIVEKKKILRPQAQTIHAGQPMRASSVLQSSTVAVRPAKMPSHMPQKNHTATQTLVRVHKNSEALQQSKTLQVQDTTRDEPHVFDVRHTKVVEKPNTVIEDGVKTLETVGKNPLEDASKLAKSPTASVKLDAEKSTKTQNFLPDKMPQYLGGKPKYPEMARLNEQTGVVVLRVWVNGQGQAEKVIVEKSSGYDQLDQTALEHVKKSEFTAAVMQGKPHATWLTLPIRFTLS